MLRRIARGQGGLGSSQLSVKVPWGVMSLCHVPHYSWREPPSFPCPAPNWPHVTLIGRGHQGVSEGQPCTCGAEARDRRVAVRAPRWGQSLCLLVGEAISVGEELLRGEPILGNVAGAATDQVVRHAAGRHGDPT